MKKLFLAPLLIILGIILYAFNMKKGLATSSIHQFKAKTIDGDVFDFSTLKGKKILIVNTASECGFTDQYKQLEEVFKKYKSTNFVVIGFPCNQFGGQEPGTNSDIKSFCSKNFGVTFLLMDKVNVKGDSICEIYKWLTKKEQNGVMSSLVTWNFQKYMIDEKGFLVDYVLPVQKPDCAKIVNWIEGK